MNDTPNLALPYILASQAQKHVTHNEAIRSLDCIVQLAVESRALTAPPATPADGSRYVVATGATGAWAGASDKIAAFQDGAWKFYEPQEGWIAWVADDQELIVHSAGAWATFSSGGGGGGDPAVITQLDSLAHLGINATADTTNRLSLKSPASLFDNEGNGHQQKINKHAAGDTASVLYQTNYSGRAEMGLTGDDDFHFKVSPDGSAWYEGIKVDRTSGRVSFPSGGVREVLSTNRTYYVRTDGSDSNNGLANTSSGAFLTIQKAVNAVAALDLGIFNVTISVGAGTFTGGVNANGAFVGSGLVTIVGSGSGSTTIARTSADCITASNGAVLTISGLKLQTTTAGSCAVANSGGLITVAADVNFGVCATFHMAALGGFISIAASAMTISGGAVISAYADIGGTIANAGALALTVSGTPVFASRFAAAGSLGLIRLPNMTFTGSATGTRYTVDVNAVINTGGGGASYFPGSSAGSASTGGQYI